MNNLKKLFNPYMERNNLSKSEKDVLIHTIQGTSNKEIANKFNVSEKTIKFHNTNIFKKTNTSNRTKLCFNLFLEVLKSVFDFKEEVIINKNKNSNILPTGSNSNE